MRLLLALVLLEQDRPLAGVTELFLGDLRQVVARLDDVLPLVALGCFGVPG
ncbi:hypothetical protein ACFVG1_31265 [Streptomyces bacillaris]|uniref:hypothetical protein n=1 Tax=Streptomyces bacillaris TaxID=68179 RepID=UPI0035DA1FC3